MHALRLAKITVSSKVTNFFSCHLFVSSFFLFFSLVFDQHFFLLCGFYMY